jgi:hypothetical protein
MVMPHDRKNQPLAVGDEVIVRAKVASIQPDEGYCNATIETIEGRKPDGAKEMLCLNAAVLEKAE